MRGAFRRAELVALDVEDLRFTTRGLYVWIEGAKNDPRKARRELYVPRLRASSLCAVATLERWLDVVGTAGPVFRTFDLHGRLTANRRDPGDVARILRRRCVAAGIDGDFACHSLRRGFITYAAQKKIPIERIKRVTGQRSNAKRAQIRRFRNARRRPAAARDPWVTCSFRYNHIDEWHSHVLRAPRHG